MVNRLKMAQINTIQTLISQGWSFRRIARELGIHRGTVARYARLGDPRDPKPAIPTAGSQSGHDPKPAIPTAGNPGRRSCCEPHREFIKTCVTTGLSAQRIYQDLVADHGFANSYESVKRFVRHLRPSTPFPFRRMECAPGEEAQIDFGKGAWIVQPDGKRRRPHVLRVVLSHSRKGYSEAVFRQTTESLIRALENAFAHFGDVPKTIVPDNLKAAVTLADWYDPDINPKFASFAQHCGFAVLPTRPYTPRHKGKVESGVNYAQSNALKGRTFADLGSQNRFLLDWEMRVADLRIHGTTRKQVRKLFEEQERAALLPLPVNRFPVFEESERTVHRDGYVEVAKAYYSMPPEFVGRRVWVRWDSHLVRAYDQKFRPLRTHARQSPGRFSTHDDDIVKEKRSSIEQGAGYLLQRASSIGQSCSEWARALMKRRGVQAIRVLQGFLALTNKHSSKDLERACAVALSHDVFRLKTLRTLLKQKVDGREQIEFLDTHPIIRNLDEYEECVLFASESLTPFPNSPRKEKP